MIQSKVGHTPTCDNRVILSNKRKNRLSKKTFLNINPQMVFLSDEDVDRATNYTVA